MRTLYRYSGFSSNESQHGLKSAMFANGTLSVRAAPGPIRLLSAAGPSHVCSFGYSEHDAATVSFRRSWHDIRSNRMTHWLLHFVLSGRLELSQAGDSYVVNAGECAIIDMDEPFFSRALPGDKRGFRCSFVAIPEHLVLSHLPWATRLTSPLRIAATQRRQLERLFGTFCQDSGEATAQTLDLMFEGLLGCIGELVPRNIRHTNPARVADRHLAAIKDAIEKQFTQRGLTLAGVASVCRISSRYLCYLLRATGTSYSELLWNRRLTRARELLASSAQQHRTIAEISLSSGFGSAAHFSRHFRQRFGLSPAMYRSMRKP